jgi:phospholipid/cholesterol/gamma-HCH transport system substrate-binding protein
LPNCSLAAVTGRRKSAIFAAHFEGRNMVRASNVMIGTLALALIAGALSGWLGYRKYAGIQRQVPLRVIFEGSASGLRRGGSVNFAGVRIGEVEWIRLDRHRVIAMTRIDKTAPIKKDTQVGLEFQGLTGIAAISFTGGTDEAPLPPTGADGIPELTADPLGTMGIQEKIRAVLRNVDTVIDDNEDAIKDTLRGFETFTASLSSNGEKISSVISTAEAGVSAVDDGMSRTEAFLKSLGSDKYGGELLPTVISLRELIESFDKKSGALMADTRKMLGDISQSVNQANRKFGGTGGGR